MSVLVIKAEGRTINERSYIFPVHIFWYINFTKWYFEVLWDYTDLTLRRYVGQPVPVLQRLVNYGW